MENMIYRLISKNERPSLDVVLSLDMNIMPRARAAPRRSSALNPVLGCAPLAFAPLAFGAQHSIVRIGAR